MAVNVLDYVGIGIDPKTGKKHTINYLPKVADWEEAIYQYEPKDKIIGGVDGIDNIQAQQLSNRTEYLKAQTDTHAEDIKKIKANNVTLSDVAAAQSAADNAVRDAATARKTAEAAQRTANEAKEEAKRSGEAAQQNAAQAAAAAQRAAESAAQAVGEIDAIAEQKASTKVNKSGDTLTGNLTVPSIYANDWFRVNGENNGVHWEKYGGGWYMTDNEWIRVWNGKGIYTSGKIRCDAGFEGNLRGKAATAGRTDSAATADRAANANNADNASIAQHVANDAANMRMHWSGQGGQPTWLWGGNDPHNMYIWNPSNFRVANANTVGDRSLQWILEQINGAKSGIVAGNLAQNGWVKFANGLIVQWMYCIESGGADDYKYFPIKFPRTLFYINANSNHHYRWNGPSWTYKVDTEKFTCGVSNDYVTAADYYMFVLAIGI